MINLKVELGRRSYPIYIGEGILDQLGEMFEIYGLGQQVLVVTDSRVHELYGERLQSSLKSHTKSYEVVVLAPGEPSKALRVVNDVITQMLEFGYERGGCVVAFGGGVIGDLAGFVASIYKRGMPFVQVPTTLLAQVDASIGGKTGVNHALGKNLIGSFYQPKMIWSDLELLRTLPKREIICGLGEIVKYGVIKDAELFAEIESNIDRILSLDAELMPEIVRRCCEIKAEIVAADEQEHGQRAVLNFGHTIGHALETALGYGKISHGEAVLMGMFAEGQIAMKLNLLDADEFGRIESLIQRLALKPKLKDLDRGKLFEAMQQDKKKSAGALRFVLPKRIGEVVVVEEVRDSQVQIGLQFLIDSFT